MEEKCKKRKMMEMIIVFFHWHSYFISKQSRNQRLNNMHNDKNANWFCNNFSFCADCLFLSVILESRLNQFENILAFYLEWKIERKFYNFIIWQVHIAIMFSTFAFIHWYFSYSLESFQQALANDDVFRNFWTNKTT